MAAERRSPEGSIHRPRLPVHSHRFRSGVRLRECAPRWDREAPATTMRDCDDNARCESFFATLEYERADEYERVERETVDTTSVDTTSEARLSTFEFIEGWYNPNRLQSGIGDQSPNRCEGAYQSRDPSPWEESPSPGNLFPLSRREHRRRSTLSAQLHLLSLSRVLLICVMDSQAAPHSVRRVLISPERSFLFVYNRRAS